MRGDAITRSELQQYLDYTVHFYAWAHHRRPTVAQRCAVFDAKEPCARLQGQVLVRLIQERVVRAYARAHNIGLSQQDRSRVQQELEQLRTAQGGDSLLGLLGVTPAFMESVLRNELLVQKVEEAVTPSWTKAGPSFHLRKFVVHAGSGRAEARDEAVTLATAGAPVPPGTDTRVEWVASFRIPAALKRLLNAAEPGQYAGPVPHGDGYLVVQLLGRSKHHAYGGPARQPRMTGYFHAWLARAVRKAAPQCFDMASKTVTCPLPKP